ncbi:tyrosine-type recombinase/integrase [Gordonia sputi]|uniref:tyrosine-type recombinase/integrase n=1 Tax=Gordonia sputi TaxID=36823 RepID=UPI0036AC3C02
MPLSRWLEIWKETKGGSPSSRVTRETMLRVHIIPELGRTPLSLIAPADIERFARRLEESRSVATAYQAMSPLRQAIGLAVREGLIQRDPTAGVKLRKPRPNEPVPLTHEQRWALADAAASESDRTLFLTFGYSGTRWGELSALRRRNLRSDGRLRLTHALSEPGGKLVEGPLKDHASRTVPIPDRVYDELLSLVKDKKPDDLLFHTRNGTPLRNGNFRRSTLSPALDRADLPRTITPHNFRDTAASLAIEAGASVVAVARMLGHEDASTTLRHYASLFPDTFDGITERMNTAIDRLMGPIADDGSEQATDTTPTQTRVGDIGSQTKNRV